MEHTRPRPTPSADMAGFGEYRLSVPQARRVFLAFWQSISPYLLFAAVGIVAAVLVAAKNLQTGPLPQKAQARTVLCGGLCFSRRLCAPIWETGCCLHRCGPFLFPCGSRRRGTPFISACWPICCFLPGRFSLCVFHGLPPGLRWRRLSLSFMPSRVSAAWRRAAAMG